MQKTRLKNFYQVLFFTFSAELESGENADYQCQYTGTPQPEVRWTLNNKPLDTTRFRVLNSGDRSRLIMMISAYSDTGDLKCFVRNQLGKDESKLSIKVSGEHPVSR